MPNSKTNEKKYLSINQILSETMVFCKENQSSIFNSLKYPGLGILLTAIISTEEFRLLDIPLIILELYFYFIFVVRCHRLFLLNESPESIRGALLWDKRNTTFMFTSFALVFGLGVMFIPTIMFASPIGKHFVFRDDSFMYLVYLTSIPFGYMFSRLSLVFPAIAVDEQNDFQRAWLISKGNGWKLFFLISIIPLTTSFIIEAINNEEILFNFVTALLGVFVLVFEIVILSNSYRILERINKIPNKSLSTDSVKSPTAG